jgi:hypothetical protein
VVSAVKLAGQERCCFDFGRWVVRDDTTEPSREALPGCWLLAASNRNQAQTPVLELRSQKLKPKLKCLINTKHKAPEASASAVQSHSHPLTPSTQHSALSIRHPGSSSIVQHPARREREQKTQALRGCLFNLLVTCYTNGLSTTCYCIQGKAQGHQTNASHLGTWHLALAPCTDLPVPHSPFRMFPLPWPCHTAAHIWLANLGLNEC